MRVFGKIQFVHLVLLVVMVGLAGCIPQGGSSDPNEPKNHLKGMELDLAFLDVAMSMHKINKVLLTEMPISADAEWPEELAMPMFESKEQKKAYHDELEQVLSRDFAFFDYYGDMDMANLFSFETFTERPIIEAAQKVALTVVHQRKTITANDSCDFVKKPLEKQILSSYDSRGLNAWLSAPVGVDNLRRVKAVNCASYSNFQEAFISLLPADSRREYKKAVNEYEELAAQQIKLEGDIEAAEVEVKTLKKLNKEKRSEQAEMKAGLNGSAEPSFTDSLFGDSAAAEEDKTAKPAEKQQVEAKKQPSEKDIAAIDGEIKKNEATIKTLEEEKIPAMKAQLAELEQEVEAKKAAYEKIIETAMQSPEITEENYLLAQKMVTVIEAIDGNLNKATVGATAVLAKVGVDIVNLTHVMKQSGWEQRIIGAMAVEIAQKNNLEMEQAQKLALKRIGVIVKRILLLVPNLYQAYGETLSTKFLLDPQLNYLNEIIVGWESVHVTPEENDTPEEVQS